MVFMEMKFRRRLIVFLIVVALIAEISITFAAPPDESNKSEPTDVDVGVDDVWEPPTDEPLPCTNQRYKAWFGGS